MYGFDDILADEAGVTGQPCPKCGREFEGHEEVRAVEVEGQTGWQHDRVCPAHSA